MKRNVVIVVLFLTITPFSGLYACQPGPTVDQEITPLPPATTPIPVIPIPPPPKPASFQISNIAITPTEIISGSSLIIQATVNNTGELSGNYTVELKLDGIVADSQTISLSGGASQNISFNKALSEIKTYEVRIGDQSGTFVVKATPVILPAPVPVVPPPEDLLTKDAGLDYLLQNRVRDGRRVSLDPPDSSGIYPVRLRGDVTAINGRILSLSREGSHLSVDINEGTIIFLALERHEELGSYSTKDPKGEDYFKLIKIDDFVTLHVEFKPGEYVKVVDRMLLYPAAIKPSR